MRHAATLLGLAFVGALTLAGAGPAGAQLVNGTFDGGLNGWTVTATGGGGAMVLSTGNPGPAAYLWDMYDNAGTATLSQTFNCGGGSDGVCFLSLEYATDVTGGANMAVTVTLDNVVVYSATHPSTVTTYTPVLFSAPCGEHTLAITAGSTASWGFAHWMLILDNVTASCVPPVSTEARTWSGLKVMYR